MKRRDFVQKIVVSSVGVSLTPSLFANVNFKKQTTITILHTNDTHSNIDPFPTNHPRFSGMGGVSNRYELIKKIREEKKNVLLFDAGDIFQGTPYFNKYGGILEMKLMSKLKYDAATMGNHDFDAGLSGFMKAKEYASFPFLCANYDFKNTLLDSQTLKNKIFDIDGIKIGVFGIGVGLKNLVPEKLYGETKYLDPIEISQQQVKELKDKKCDLIICLSHLGYEYSNDKISDKILAQKTKGIDLIIGGHTHTFLEKPTPIINLDGNITLVNQVGWGGINLGRIDFDVEKKHFIKNETIIVN